MSRWAFRFLLWFIVILFVQPQNRFYFLHPLHIADIVAIGAVLLHLASAMQEGRPIMRWGAGTKFVVVILSMGLVAQYAGLYMTDTSWNQSVDVLVKACVIGILIEAMADTVARVWAVQATLLLSVLWWVKGGLRLSAAGATYSGDRLMGAAVSLIENPNAFAYFMSAYVPLFFFFYRQTPSKKWKWVYLALIVASVYITLETGSRTGFLTLVGLVIVSVPTLAKQERKVALIGVVAMYLVIGAISEGNIERFRTIKFSITSFLMGDEKKAETPDEESAVERYYRNKHTWNLIKTHPLGVGMNPDPTMYPEEVFFAKGQAHCEILMAGRAMGFPGMIIYIACLAYSFIVGRKIEIKYRLAFPDVANMGWLFKVQALVFAIGGAFSPTPFNYPEIILLCSCSTLVLNLKEQH